MDLRLIQEAWSSLQPFRGLEKCGDCECLQAAVTELAMALEGLPAEPENERLLKAVRNGLDLSRLHGCLGCDPCEPADVLSSFYVACDARGAAVECDCGSSCPDGAPAARCGDSQTPLQFRSP